MKAVRHMRNCVSHELARIGRVNVKIAILLWFDPDEAIKLCELDTGY